MTACSLHGPGTRDSDVQPRTVDHSDRENAYHFVAPGETLWGIAQQYGVDLRQLAQANNILPPYTVRPDRRLIVPGGPLFPRDGEAGAGPAGEFDSEGPLVWPVRGTVCSGFGMRGGLQHTGIRIAAPRGSPVCTAAAGTVGFVGTLQGLGPVVLVEHTGRYLTVYANLGEILVSTGQAVEQGTQIGALPTAPDSHAELYFEVRHRSKPVDPIPFLEDPSVEFPS